jgi:Xaa-Pro aminopeptidase
VSVAPREIRISTEEHLVRCSRLADILEQADATGAVLFDSTYILYFTGFAFIPTERPMAFVMNRDGKRGMYVPRLELEHAQANAIVDTVEYYLEYPDSTHPMQDFQKMLESLAITEAIAADDDGYPWILGYRGPSLSELTGAKIQLIRGQLEDLLMIKSEAELGLIRESVRWGNLAHTLLQRYTDVGATETEVRMQASDDATMAMLDAIGPIYRAQSPFSSGASAGYRGQIGRNAAIPHAMAANITFQSGDVLVTGAGAPVWGYNSELERTMIIGPASDDQRVNFDHMVALQDLAIEAIRPGDTCAKVDSKVRAYFEEHGLKEYWRHHTGHAIGLRYHEGPFLDIGDDTVMQPGMVFTVEPGIYVPELGGFRHSDTVVVTEDGVEVLTYYARDLESLTI